jgi:hypothetical protein
MDSISWNPEGTVLDPPQPRRRGGTQIFVVGDNEGLFSAHRTKAGAEAALRNHLADCYATIPEKMPPMPADLAALRELLSDEEYGGGVWMEEVELEP